METFNINRYIIEVESDHKKEGDTVNVYIRANNAKQYKFVYRLVWNFGESIRNLAGRAFGRYTMGTPPDGRAEIQAGIVDESGARRYTMTVDKLQTLYKDFENFVADCTEAEYKENKESITAVYALIHKHINAGFKK